MKAIKIGLVIAVIGLIGYFACNSFDDISDPPLPEVSEETEVSNIQNKIDAISALPNSKFNKDIYDDILYVIDDKYKPHPPAYPFGRLGDTQLENDQQKDNLRRNLYTAYVSKFLDQAFYVFNGTAWNIEDLNFIRSESKILKRSSYFGTGGSVSTRFNEIERIFSKYDEINSFVSSCDSWEPPLSASDSLIKDPFPIDEIRSKLDQVQTYRSSKLGNRYVNNCIRLHNKLSDVPQTLFYKHFKWLDKKIDNYLGLYEFYGLQKAYQEELYTPIKEQIEVLDSGIYEDTEITRDTYDFLTNKWNADANKSYGFWD